MINPISQQGMSSQENERLILLGKGVAEVAHQLSNSFDSIRRFLSLSLACADNKDKSIQYILEAKAALERVSLLAESLLNFVRKDRLNPQRPLMLQGMLEDILSLYNDKIMAHGIELITDWGENNHLLLPADLYHVFLNLIKNAIEAMPLGGTLRVLTHLENGKLEVAVSDTGVGIPEHLREKLFKPFFTTKGKSGTGLGLALSSEIVKRYGGSISYESKPWQGSTFIVTIPVNRQNNARA